MQHFHKNSPPLVLLPKDKYISRVAHDSMDLKPHEGWSNLSVYRRFCVLNGHNDILEDLIFLNVKMTFQPLQHLLFHTSLDQFSLLIV